MLWLRPSRNMCYLARRFYAQFHDPLDQATGIEKRELLAHLSGDCDPFRILAIKKGSKSRNNYI